MVLIQLNYSSCSVHQYDTKRGSQNKAQGLTIKPYKTQFNNIELVNKTRVQVFLIYSFSSKIYLNQIFFSEIC